MSGDQPASLLSQLAEIFRREGDLATAAALDRQIQAEVARSLDEEDNEWLRTLERRALACEKVGNYEEAIPSWKEALRVVTAVHGVHHVAIDQHLNNLARCRWNAGEYAEAMHDYMHLLRIMEQTYGHEDPLTKITRDNVERCRQALRDRAATQRLHHQIGWMLHHAQATRALDLARQRDRMLGLTRRLISHGRTEAAGRLCDRLIALRMEHADPDDGLALSDIREYAMVLWEAGDLAKASVTLRKLVMLRNRLCASGEDKSSLRTALADLASCLAAMGHVRSSNELANLTNSIKGVASN